MSLQFANKADARVICGVSQSGKSTFAIRYMLNAPLTCRFIFDARGEYAQRLNMRPVINPQDMEAAIASGWVIFDPRPFYPGLEENPEVGQQAFFDFCRFAFNRSENISGQKLFYVTEAWQFCSQYKIPMPFARIAQDGRKNGLGLMLDTQRPNRINEAILNEAKEWICFRLRGVNALKSVVAYSWIDCDEVRDLPDLHFVSELVDYGTQTRGQIVL